MTQFEHVSEKLRNFFGSVSGHATQPGAGCRSARPQSHSGRPQVTSNNKIFPENDNQMIRLRTGAVSRETGEGRSLSVWEAASIIRTQTSLMMNFTVTVCC